MTVTASDGVTSTPSTFSVSVANTNDAPVLTNIAGLAAHGAAINLSVNEGATLNVAYR